MKQEQLVLGIETSCDDTSVALLKHTKGKIPEILAVELFNQEKILEKFGGIVPEIASRNHTEKLPYLLKDILTQTNITLDKIDIIGVTTHPGLLGPLLTGINAAKTLSLVNKTPIIPINHIYAHIEAIFLDQSSVNINYPYIGLAISGGHTAFFLVKNSSSFALLGTTIDDAAGEAFDKGGKILNLQYPAGRVIDQRSKLGDENYHKFPIGLQNQKNSTMSFSGLKTSLKDYVFKNSYIFDQENKDNFNNICASYQKAIVGAISLKLKYAIIEAKSQTGLETLPIVIGGGVACNSQLRETISSAYKNVYFVPAKYCTDNAAMIANLACRTPQNVLNFPMSLEIDAKSRIINKKEFIR